MCFCLTWQPLRGGAYCLSDQWQIREVFSKHNWLFFFFLIRLNKESICVKSLCKSAQCELLLAYDCGLTLREMKPAFECKNASLSGVFVDIFAHNHGSFWTDVDWDEVHVADMWPKLDLVIIYVHFVFKRCFNISSRCQEAEVYFCTS